MASAFRLFDGLVCLNGALRACLSQLEDYDLSAQAKRGDVWSYDTVAGSWTEAASVAVVRYQHVAVIDWSDRTGPTSKVVVVHLVSGCFSIVSWPNTKPRSQFVAIPNLALGPFAVAAQGLGSASPPFEQSFQVSP